VLHFANVFAIETMHNFLLGAVKRIVLLLQKLFKVVDKGTKRKRDGTALRTIRKVAAHLSAGECEDLYNARMTSFQSCGIVPSENISYLKRFLYTPRFLQATDVKHLKASDFKFIIQMLQFVIGSGPADFFIPDFTIKIKELLWQANELGQLLYSTSSWTDAKLTRFDSVLETFGSNMRDCFHEVSPSELKFIKLHRMTHISEDIRAYGSPRNYLGDPWELSHQSFVKWVFPRTNGKDSSMLQEVLRRELLLFTRKRLETLAIYENAEEGELASLEDGAITFRSPIGEAFLVRDEVGTNTYGWKRSINQELFSMNPDVPVGSVMWPPLMPETDGQREKSIRAFGSLVASEMAHFRPSISHVNFFKEMQTPRYTLRADRCFRGQARFDVVTLKSGELSQILTFFSCCEGKFAVVRMLERVLDCHSKHLPYATYILKRSEYRGIVTKIVSVEDISLEDSHRPYLVPDFSSVTAGKTPSYFLYTWWH
jgi:hypothetical protein